MGAARPVIGGAVAPRSPGRSMPSVTVSVWSRSDGTQRTEEVIAVPRVWPQAFGDA